MNGFKNRLAAFFRGRYGIDELYFLSLFVFLIIAVARIFTQGIMYWILFALEAAVLVYSFFRMLSRNIEKRRKENAWLVKLINKRKIANQIRKDKKRDKNTHVYRKCPICKTVLRLPKISGSHTATCPRCHKKFEVKVK